MLVHNFLLTHSANLSCNVDIRWEYSLQLNTSQDSYISLEIRKHSNLFDDRHWSVHVPLII